jgi:hypothetical protein
MRRRGPARQAVGSFKSRLHCLLYDVGESIAAGGRAEVRPRGLLALNRSAAEAHSGSGRKAPQCSGTARAQECGTTAGAVLDVGRGRVERRARRCRTHDHRSSEASSAVRAGGGPEPLSTTRTREPWPGPGANETGLGSAPMQGFPLSFPTPGRNRDHPHRPRRPRKLTSRPVLDDHGASVFPIPIQSAPGFAAKHAGACGVVENAHLASGAASTLSHRCSVTESI